MSRPTTLHVVKPEPEPKREERVGLFNPDFKYVHSTRTDIRKTFARIKREQANTRRS